MSVRYRDDRERWEVRWREGSRHRSRLFRFEQDALDFDNELYRRRRTGIDLAFDRGTRPLWDWGAYAFETYLRPDLDQSTATTYAYQWDKHVLPRLGDFQLRQLDAGVIARFQADMRRDHVGDPTIRRVMALLQGMLKHAVIEGEIPANPVAMVGRPRLKRGEWPDPVPPILTERILTMMPSPMDRIMVELVAYAGLRPGEALGVQAQHLIGNKLRVYAPKTKRSRVVDVIDPLADDLRDYLAGRETGYLVHLRGGRRFTDTSWRNWRRRVWQPHGAPLLDGDRRLYRMRGSFASLLAWEGKPITYVARQLGHSVETCSRYYLGVFEQYDVAHQLPAADAVRQARERVRHRDDKPPGAAA